MNHGLKVAGVIAFLAVDVVLIGVLFRHTNAGNAQTTTDAGDSVSSSKGVAGTSPTTEPTKAAGEVTLVAAASGNLIKVTRGTCTSNGRPMLELSNDGGKLFKEVALPLLAKSDDTTPGSQAPTVSTILQIDAKSTTEYAAVATDDNCVAHGYVTDDGGASWRKIRSIKVWYLSATGDEVVSPEGASEPGCEVVSLSPFSDRNAKVACADGSIRGTDDNGKNWVTLGRLKGLTAATFVDLRNGFAVAADDGCMARAYSTTNLGLDWKPAGCIDDKKSVSSIAGSAGKLEALVGTEISSSADGGATWKKP